MNQIYIECFFACLFGNLIHLAALLRSRSIDYKKNNDVMTFRKFVSEEKYGLMLDFVGSMACVYLADEFIAEDSLFILGKIKTLFVIIGITGSWIIMQLTSVTKRNFRSSVDKKSNIADSLDKKE